MSKSNIKTLIILNIMLMIYSMSGICSKMAANATFLSLKFCFLYAIIIGLLGFYAIGWQQIIKRLPLTLAFANKAITIVWGLIWGIIFFGEKVTIGKIVGIVFVVAGIITYVRAEDNE